MRLMEMLGHALRPVRSDAAKMLSAQPEAETPLRLEVASQSFKDGEAIPVECTMDGASKFCAIRWSNVPDGTRSILVVCEDPDIPKAMPFIHVMAYNIPPGNSMLPSDAFNEDGTLSESYAKLGVKLGGNSVGQPKWMGPSPPPGHGPHHYYFQVFALDKTLNFDGLAKMPELKEVISGHVLAYGEVVGTYERGS